MEWDLSLETGVEKIDNQHKALFERIDQINVAGKNGTSSQELFTTLIFFKRYVEEHFRDEEQLQLESKYPKYEQHKQVHEIFIKKIDELFDKCEKEGSNILTILETNKTVYDWLATHINKVDMEFAAYYRNFTAAR